MVKFLKSKFPFGVNALADNNSYTNLYFRKIREIYLHQFHQLPTIQDAALLKDLGGTRPNFEKISNILTGIQKASTPCDLMF